MLCVHLIWVDKKSLMHHTTGSSKGGENENARLSCPVRGQMTFDSFNTMLQMIAMMILSLVEMILQNDLQATNSCKRTHDL